MCYLPVLSLTYGLFSSVLFGSCTRVGCCCKTAGSTVVLRAAGLAVVAYALGANMSAGFSTVFRPVGSLIAMLGTALGRPTHDLDDCNAGVVTVGNCPSNNELASLDEYSPGFIQLFTTLTAALFEHEESKPKTQVSYSIYTKVSCEVNIWIALLGSY